MASLMPFYAFKIFHNTPNVFRIPIVTLKKLLTEPQYPQKPKRPLHAPFLYALGRAAEMRKKDNTISQKEALKLAFQEWPSVNAEEKIRLNETCSQAMKKYKDDIFNHKIMIMKQLKDKDKSSANAILEDLGITITNKDLEKLGKPKRPLPVHVMLYKDLLDERIDEDKFNISEANKVWAKASDELKEKYKTKYKVLFEKYQKDMLTWEKEMQKKGLGYLLRKKTVDSLSNVAKKNVALD